MAFAARSNTCALELNGTLPLLSGKTVANIAGNRSSKIFGRPNMSASSPIRKQMPSAPLVRNSQSAQSPVKRRSKNNVSGSMDSPQLGADVEQAHMAAVERAMKSIQKQRLIKQKSQEEEMRERQLKAAKIQAKNTARRRLRSEVYAINAFLKEQEQIRYEGMMKTLGDVDLSAMSESGDDSSVSVGSGDGPDTPAAAQAPTKKEKKGKPSFGV